jgi:hypothetical protein
MKNFKLLFFCLLLIISGCDRTQFIERQEDKLIGQWDFKRVVKVENFNRNNITNQYKEQVITFKGDGTMQWENFETQDYWEGSYQVFYYNNIGGDDGSSESSLRLEANLTDTSNNEIMEITFENLNVFNNRMNFDLRDEGIALEVRMIK